MSSLTEADYQALLEFRTGLRRYLHWSAGKAEEAGLTMTQHQLMLAIRGDPGPDGPTIGEVAGHLLVRHHSAVELVDRAVAAGLVRRRPDPDDHRVVRLELTAKAARKLEALASQHLAELARLTPRIGRIWAGLGAN